MLSVCSLPQYVKESSYREQRVKHMQTHMNKLSLVVFTELISTLGGTNPTQLIKVFTGCYLNTEPHNADTRKMLGNILF